MLLRETVWDVLTAIERWPSWNPDVKQHLESRSISPAPDDQGGAMRHAFMSIHKAFGTYLEGMTRVAETAQSRNPGACRRR